MRDNVVGATHDMLERALWSGTDPNVTSDAIHGVLTDTLGP